MIHCTILAFDLFMKFSTLSSPIRASALTYPLEHFLPGGKNFT